MKRSKILTACLLALLLLGCNVPVKLPYLPHAQHQIQSIEHWDFIAANVAQEVYLALERTGNLTMPVFVEKPDRNKFDEGFHDFLLSELTKKGLQIAPNDSQGLSLAFNTMVVKHRAYRDTPSHGEVLVTATLHLQSTLLAHVTDSFYVQDRDIWHYTSKEMPAPYAKTYETKAE
jgi:hypothetical protein